MEQQLTHPTLCPSRARLRRLATALLFLPAGATAQQQADYSQGGCFVINEDWYTHANSTLNWLSDEGEWTYRAFQKANSGMELGATACFGALHEGRLYIVAKQEKDPGATITGGRLTVCDAQTLECLAQLPAIGAGNTADDSPDGRAFLGIDSEKAYVSTNNGIYLFDLATQTFGEQIPGSSNPNDDFYGLLYRGQCGRMALAGDTAYAIHQSAGVLLIETKSDRTIRAIQAPMDGTQQRGFGSIVQSKDGALWLSVAADTEGTGGTAPYLIRLDPATGDTLRFPLPDDGTCAPANSWYAWTPDAFCASAQENALYWSGGSDSWFAGEQIFKYDIDRNEFRLLIDLAGSGWKLYGCSMGIHPQTGEIYLSLYHDFNDPTYVVRRYSPEGSLLQEYSMINYYWFPGMFLFPGTETPTGVSAPETGGGLRIAWDGHALGVEGGEGLTCRIYGTGGQLLRSFRCSGGTHREEILLPPGSYIATAGDGAQAQSLKFLVP